MGWIPHSSTYCQIHVGSVATSLRARRLRPSLLEAWSGKPLGMLDRELGSLPWVDERGRRGRQEVKSRLPALIVGWRSGVDHS
jgi:hypothetical protein